MVKDWKDLSESTKNRYKYALERAERSRFTIAELKNMDNNELAKVFNSTPEAMKRERRIWAQIKSTKERRQNSISEALKDYKGSGKELVAKNLRKTVGNTFDFIADDIQKKYEKDLGKAVERKRVENLTEVLLKIPKNKRKALNDREIENILDYWSPT